MNIQNEHMPKEMHFMRGCNAENLRRACTHTSTTLEFMQKLLREPTHMSLSDSNENIKKQKVNYKLL